MTEALPEGISRQEFSELLGDVKELREAMAELKEARTKPEQQEARAEVREARADLAATARELGLDPAKLEAAANEVKAKDEKERLRPLLVELLDEELEATVEDAKDALTEPVEEAAAAAEEKAPKPPKPDTGPRISHWSERPLSALFGGGSDG